MDSKVNKAERVPIVDLNQSHSIYVEIRAKSVQVRDDGNYLVELPGRALSDPERDMLERLFPNTLDQAHRLLSKEALIEALVR